MSQFTDWQANSSAGPQATERAAPRVLRRVPFSGEGSAAPEVLAEREWLITNGLGGYASGTLLGAITTALSRLIDRCAAGAARPRDDAQPTNGIS